MHTFLITGASQQKRLEYIHAECKKLNIAQYDIHTLMLDAEALSIGIKQVQLFQQALMLVPMGSVYTIGIIQSAESLTIESQNALLKLLEEPPIHVHIYIECQNASLLLPTIISRSQIIPIHNDIESKQSDETLYAQLQQLINPNTSIGEKMILLDTLVTNAKEAKLWLRNAIISLRTHQLDLSTHIYSQYQKRMLVASQQLSANVSYKLVLDQIFL